jgi:hypothetical protein
MSLVIATILPCFPTSEVIPLGLRLGVTTGMKEKQHVSQLGQNIFLAWKSS